jgi:hypothetical protein
VLFVKKAIGDATVVAMSIPFTAPPIDALPLDALIPNAREPPVVVVALIESAVAPVTVLISNFVAGLVVPIPTLPAVFQKRAFGTLKVLGKTVPWLGAIT